MNNLKRPIERQATPDIFPDAHDKRVPHGRIRQGKTTYNIFQCFLIQTRTRLLGRLFHRGPRRHRLPEEPMLKPLDVPFVPRQGRSRR
jgi:hypothetical protein